MTGWQVATAVPSGWCSSIGAARACTSIYTTAPPFPSLNYIESVTNGAPARLVFENNTGGNFCIYWRLYS